MTTFEKALQLDIEQSIEQAAQAYEDVITRGDASVDAYINLACLYWVHSQPGSPMDNDFLIYAGTRMYEVLDEARKKFGDLPEVIFWKLYFDRITLGEPPFLQQALKLVVGLHATLIPYFYIYGAGGDWVKYREHVLELRNQVEAQRTEKNRYILSVLKSPTLKRMLDT